MICCFLHIEVIGGNHIKKAGLKDRLFVIFYEKKVREGEAFPPQGILIVSFL